MLSLLSLYLVTSPQVMYSRLLQLSTKSRFAWIISSQICKLLNVCHSQVHMPNTISTYRIKHISWPGHPPKSLSCDILQKKCLQIIAGSLYIQLSHLLIGPIVFMGTIEVLGLLELSDVVSNTIITDQANVKAVRMAPFLGCHRWSHCWWCCWSLTIQRRKQNSGYKFVSSIKPLIFGLNQKDGLCIYILCRLK